MGVIRHGSFGMKTNYRFQQLRYSGTDCEDESQGYVELLKFENPPHHKHAVVIHVFYNGQRLIHNFRTVNQARTAFEHGYWSTFLGEKPWSKHSSWRDIRSFPGFISTIRFEGNDLPWFAEPKPDPT